jgi:pyruvate-formate lyase
LDAFKKQVDHTNELFAQRHAIEHAVEKETAAFLFMSMLTDDCIDRGKALFDEGARYLGGIIETFGLTNASDSLVAIRELVYEKKVFTLEQLVKMTDSNFEGYPRERKLLLEAPKFGNDDPVADDFHTELSQFVCQNAAAKAAKNGLHFFLNCNLNVGGLHYSALSKASADGRCYGDSFALGNAPTAGRDKRGITALLNSLSKHEEPSSGYVQNLKLSRDLFAGENLEKTKRLIETYFETGGCQLMVTALNQQDLVEAMNEPEKYPNLLVRVAGWTSKFVDLPRRYQEEIANRTFYC